MIVVQRPGQLRRLVDPGLDVKLGTIGREEGATVLRSSPALRARTFPQALLEVRHGHFVIELIIDLPRELILDSHRPDGQRCHWREPRTQQPKSGHGRLRGLQRGRWRDQQCGLDYKVSIFGM